MKYFVKYFLRIVFISVIFLHTFLKKYWKFRNLLIYSLLFNVVSKLADIIQIFMQCFYFSLILNRFFKTRICLQVLKYVKVHLLKYLPSWHVTTSWFTFVCFNFFLKFRSSHRRCSVKEAVLKNFPIFTGKHLCRDLFLINKVAGLKACNVIKNETPTQVFSCEYCDIFKSIYFEEHQRRNAFKHYSLKNATDWYLIHFKPTFHFYTPRKR